MSSWLEESDPSQGRYSNIAISQDGYFVTCLISAGDEGEMEVEESEEVN